MAGGHEEVSGFAQGHRFGVCAAFAVGGRIPGSIVAGHDEKYITLQVARKVAALLAQNRPLKTAEVRLLLRGGSIVDWHHLAFRDEADVDRFLRVNEFHPDSDADMHA